jgi:hypothetical protein
MKIQHKVGTISIRKTLLKEQNIPILIEVTRRPQALRRRPILLAVTPLPSPLTTPPVTNTYFIVNALSDTKNRTLQFNTKNSQK